MQSIYLNTASFGLIDGRVKNEADNFYAKLASEGSAVAEQWRLETEPRIRHVVAGFLGADEKNIALLPNFSWGINSIVQSLRGDEKVLLYRGDYPSLKEPFRLNRFAIRWVDSVDDFELPLNEIEKLISTREVDIVALSHVQYNSGYRLPITEIGSLCSAHGVRFLVDATQSLGAIPIDASTLHADVLIASNYKWMNAGFGTGVMCISEAFLKEYPPVVGGFNSMSLVDGAWHHSLSARSYEPGHSNMYGLLLLDASIANIRKLGASTIEAHNLSLTEQLVEGVSRLRLPLVGPPSMAHRSSFILLRDEGGLSTRIREGGFVTTNRGNRVRISMHHYNSSEDVEALLGLF